MLGAIAKTLSVSQIGKSFDVNLNFPIFRLRRLAIAFELGKKEG